jgi:hypothetical protein
MKRWLKITVNSSIAVLFIAVEAQAESGTNVSQIANIALSGFRQMGALNTTSVRITTKDIIAALNASEHFNFEPNARLVLISHDDQLPTASIREGSGKNSKTRDISDFLTITQPSEIDGANNLVSYSIRIFKFDDHNGTSFSLSGMATLRRGNITNANIGPLLRVRTSSMEVSGEGTLAGANIVIRGTINAGSAASEVD